MPITYSSLRSWLVALAAVSVLSACSDETDFDFEASQAAEQANAANVVSMSPPQALFSPADAVVPFPSNLLFVGSSDGTLAINLPEAEQALSNPQFVLNQQDGFSTSTPIVTPVSKSLDPETLILGQTVRVLEVTTPPGATAAERVNRSLAVTGSVGEIDSELAMRVAEIDQQLVLIPLQPLKASTSYMVVLTNGITDADGNPLQPSTTYSLLKGETPLRDPSSEGLRQAVGSHIELLNAQLNVEPDEVALSFVTKAVKRRGQAMKQASPTTRR